MKILTGAYIEAQRFERLKKLAELKKQPVTNILLEIIYPFIDVQLPKIPDRNPTKSTTNTGRASGKKLVGTYLNAEIHAKFQEKAKSEFRTISLQLEKLIEEKLTQENV